MFPQVTFCKWLRANTCTLSIQTGCAKWARAQTNRFIDNSAAMSYLSQFVCFSSVMAVPISNCEFWAKKQTIVGENSFH